jgi:hypothetical protein
LIVATEVFVLDQVNVVVVTLFDASRAVAVNVWFAPTIALAGFGEIATVTAGSGSAGQMLTAVALLRGAGAATLKSADAVPLSAQPALLRNTAVVLPGAEVLVPQAAELLPKLTSSTVPEGQAPVRRVVF